MRDMYAMLLGVAQDAGYPQPGCMQACCRSVWEQPERWRWAASLALVAPKSQDYWLFDLTPHFPQQSSMLLQQMHNQISSDSPSLRGAFLTHAHMGHYLGLAFLGKEGMNTQQLPIYAMPKMQQYLMSNNPWQLLLSNQNIRLLPLLEQSPVSLTSSLQVEAISVPHRGEFSETVAFRIQGPNRTLLYLPDCDRWSDFSNYSTTIEELIQSVDIALIDGTFYSPQELPHRNFDEVKHPCIEQSMHTLASLSDSHRAKVHFLHFNHTNPVLQTNSWQQRSVYERGFALAEQGQIFTL